MKNLQKATPEGTRDLLFEECKARRLVEHALSGLFQQRQYNQVMTPDIEFYDVFQRPSAGVLVQSMYKLTDNAGRLLVLRPDNTLPIARLCATRLRDVPKPIRLYYNQNVYCMSPGLSGRNHEAAQAGIELIGATGIRADLEVICIALDALDRCGAPDFRLELGHAGFFKSLADALTVEETVREELTELIESKNYAGLNDLLDILENTPEIETLRRLPHLFGGKEVLEEASAICSIQGAQDALQYLAAVYDALAVLGLGEKISIDLGLVHRNNYYTGVVFRGYVEGSGLTVLTGGRYDNLIAEFGTVPQPAIGFGVDISVLTAAALQRGAVPTLQVPDVLVFGEQGAEVKALQYAQALSTQGLTVETSIFSSYEQTQTYARQKGIARIDRINAAGDIQSQ